MCEVIDTKSICAVVAPSVEPDRRAARELWALTCKKAAASASQRNSEPHDCDDDDYDD